MTLTFKTPSEKLLEEIVYAEEKIRMSKEYQDNCTKLKDIPNGWLDYTATMQRDLVKSFGFTSDMEIDIALNMLRRSQYISK